MYPGGAARRAIVFFVLLSSSALALTVFVGGEQREKMDGRVTNTRIRFSGRSKLFPGVLFPYVTWRDGASLQLIHPGLP